jgi:hypothetical protein
VSQNVAILNHLKRKPITAQDAFFEHNCLRLAARIHDLRGQGHCILTETVRSGDKSYARYRLVK